MKKLFETFFKYWIRPWAPFVLLFTPLAFAGDNHIHIEQATNAVSYTNLRANET